MDNMPKLEFLQHAPKDNYQLSFKDEIFMCVQDPGVTLSADPRVITFLQLFWQNKITHVSKIFEFLYRLSGSFVQGSFRRGKGVFATHEAYQVCSKNEILM